MNHGSIIFLKLNSYYCIAHQHSFIDYQIKSEELEEESEERMHT